MAKALADCEKGRPPAAAGPRATDDCSTAKIAVATAQGRAAGYAYLVRTFARVDLAGAARKLDDAAASLRSLAADPRAHRLAARIAPIIRHLNAAEAAVRRTVADLDAVRRSARNATKALTKAKASLAKCKAAGG